MKIESKELADELIMNGTRKRRSKNRNRGVKDDSYILVLLSVFIVS